MEKTKLSTINIKGKEYSTVDSRVEFFRTKYPMWSLETEYPVLDLDKGVCVCRAIVKDETGRIMADGFAHEWQNKPGSMVNKTSYIENAQTSAVGRALGFIGIGINGMGIATAEEVQTAIAHQENEDFPPVKKATKKADAIEDLVGDEIPFVAPATARPDDWMSVNAFAGEANRCNDLTELQKMVNGQKGNPNLGEIVKIAAQRKLEILDKLQMEA